MSRKSSRPSRKKRRRNLTGNHLSPQKLKPTFDVEVMITKRFKPVSRIYRKKDLQILAEGECLIGDPTLGTEYKVRIVREKMAVVAMELELGEVVRLQGATFWKPPRSSCNREIHAKYFTIITKGALAGGT